MEEFKSKQSGQKVINIYGWSTYFDWNGIGELSKVVWLSYAGINIGSSMQLDSIYPNKQNLFRFSSLKLKKLGKT